MDQTKAQEKFEEFRGVQLNCPQIDGEVSQYNDLATLLMESPEKVSSMMFSIGQGEGGVYKSPFTHRSLIVYTLTYVVLMALASGLAVPCGLFMPAILAGSSTGLSVRGGLRVAGHKLRVWAGLLPDKLMVAEAVALLVMVRVLLLLSTLRVAAAWSPQSVQCSASLVSASLRRCTGWSRHEYRWNAILHSIFHAMAHGKA